MHTESQAKQLWCPMGRIAITGNGATINDPQLLNGPPGGDYACKCIASDCAAWRWFDQISRHTRHDERKGYCGLAGRGAI